MKAVLFPLLALVSFVALGQVIQPLPAEATFTDIFNQVVQIFGSWKGLAYQYKIATVLFFIVGLVKNSALSPYWNGLGKWKPALAPVLSLVAFLFMVQPFTVETAFAAITTGFAAVAFANVLDMIKTLPGVGPMVTSVIDFIGIILKRK